MIEVRVVDEAVVAVLECGLGVIDILSPTILKYERPTHGHSTNAQKGKFVM